MENDFFKNFADIAIKEVAPGFFSKLIHTPSITINFVDVKAGSNIANHQHVHEQCTFVLEGSFELTVNDITQTLQPGLFVIIPSYAWHHGIAMTDCKLIDIFSPVREDYKAL